MLFFFGTLYTKRYCLEFPLLLVYDSVESIDELTEQSECSYFNLAVLLPFGFGSVCLSIVLCYQVTLVNVVSDLI